MMNIDYNNEEKGLHKALKNFGYIFPETGQEFIEFEKSILEMKVQIPADLNSIDSILRKGKIETIGMFDSFYDSGVEENLAQAAREGGDIPEDILKRMEEDRDKAEDSNDEE